MLPPPLLFEVRRGGAVPALAVLLVERDLAQRCIDQAGEVLGHERQRLIQVDRARDRLAHVGDQLELVSVPLGVFVQTGHLDGHRQLRGRGAQRLDLAPVRAALVRTVIADLEHARRASRLVAAEGHEDAHQVLVAAAVENLARERERSRLARPRALAVADEDREDTSLDHAVAVHHGDLDPRVRSGDAARHDVAAVGRRQRADDGRLPAPRHVDEDVLLGQEPVLLERPLRDPLARLRRRARRRLDRGGRRPARGHAHHDPAVVSLVEQVDRGEVEVEFGHVGVREMADHDVDDLVPRCAWLEDRDRDVAERAQQPVAVLEVGDQALCGERAADQLRAGSQHLVGRRRAPHRGEAVAAQHDEVAVWLLRLAQRIRRDGVQVGFGGGRGDRRLDRRNPRDSTVAAVHAHRGGDAQVRGDQLEVRAMMPELVDGRAVQVARHEQVGQRDGQQATQLLGVRPRVADRRGEQRGQARQPIEGGALGCFEGVLDEGRSGRSPAFQLPQPVVVGRLLSRAVVEVDEPEQPVARQQREADGGLDLIAADEGGVDLGRRVASHQALSGDREPDRRPVLVHAELVLDLALALVGQVARELLVHVGQRVEQSLLRLAGGEGRVVDVRRLFVKDDRDDVGSAGLLEVRDHAAQDRGEA